MLRKTAIALWSCPIAFSSFCATHARAAEKDAPLTWPERYVVHENSTSPDGQFGILVASRDLAIEDDTIDFENFLANLKTHQVLGKINDADYFQNRNHRGLEVVWAADSSACVLTYEGRFGYDMILLLELNGARFTQTGLGEHIAKALKSATRDDGTDSAWFRFTTNKKLLARALTYTGNPKEMDEKTRQARFAGTFDRVSRKWIVSEARRTTDWDALSDAYSAKHGEDIFVAPNGDQSKVPPEFIGAVVNSEEEKEQRLDTEMNTVYKAVRILLPPAKFAKVKQEEVAWLKKRDAIPVGQRSDLVIARIKALEEFLWN